MALGLTQPLTEMSTRNLPGGKGRPARKAHNLTAICEPIIYKMSEPRRLTNLWASTFCYRDSFIFIFRGADKSLAFAISSFPICSTTKRMFLGWVKEVRTTKL
jgi:hypothetical protein